VNPVFGLDEATALARRAHAGQTDKAGRPYIEHPLRVMHRLRGEYEQLAAILHDVLEDTPVTENDLRSAGCPEPVVAG
jgi:(p)ppGpp synthase/HD superfamily hydrolase